METMMELEANLVRWLELRWGRTALFVNYQEAHEFKHLLRGTSRCKNVISSLDKSELVDTSLSIMEVGRCGVESPILFIIITLIFLCFSSIFAVAELSIRNGKSFTLQFQRQPNRFFSPNSLPENEELRATLEMKVAGVKCTLTEFLQRNIVASNCVVEISAMSNACITRVCGNQHRAIGKVCPRKTIELAVLRSFSTSTSPLINVVSPLVIRAPPSLVLAARLTPSDAPQRSEEWFALRRDKLTTSTFSTALGFWKGNRRSELWQEKVFSFETQSIEASKRCAMEWGVLNEEAAIDRYKSITGRDVSFLGFATHPEQQFEWLGASPDAILDCFPGGGILEVKCPYNKGKPEMGLPWSKMPFYYMPQVQGQMEIMNLDWVDLYCWTPNGSTIFRVCRARAYWELIHGILRDFWWENVVPAREALLVGRKEEAALYKPTSTHKLTGLAIAKSIHLASEAKLVCREVAGYIEFYK